MKYHAFLTVIMFAGILSCTHRKSDQQEEVISLPVTFVDGFGPFGTDYAATGPEYSADDPDGGVWAKTYKPLTGIPPQWKNVARSMVELNLRQFVFQNFHQGNIDSSTYASLQKAWKWTPDEKRLSKKPIRCYVYIIWGTDPSGKLNVMIDTNNNGDFSDEKSFYPEIAGPKDTIRYYNHSYEIEYDIFREGRVITSHLPMVLKYFPHQPEKYRMAYSFPRYAEAVIPLGGHQKKIAINLGFTSPSGNEVSELAFADQVKKGEYIDLRNGIRIGEFLDIESGGERRRFENLGFDEYEGVLHLKGKPLNNVYSTQVGFKMKPFSGKDFTNGKPVSMEDYRGKYLYIDFWATWCGPCVKQLPELKHLYQKVDRNKIAFLGIVGEDSRERLAKFLDKNPLDWPQLFSDSTNQLVEAYNIEGYPSTFLIGPYGTIVGKNLSSKELEAKFAELGGLK
ncbi:Peroxiredoxin [Dyadobacter soli]|uniref:Peroxiredoxin n=1 Tax=Dyadobacter soli TaxID=659014 RepID=A0A1G7G158_9BACT|nr:TlpA disulfide reductase family protein [Dyadobacter soli]SDE81850.1 Peroxiredoxin [Dyadobacter soli]